MRNPRCWKALIWKGMLEGAGVGGGERGRSHWLTPQVGPPSPEGHSNTPLIYTAATPLPLRACATDCWHKAHVWVGSAGFSGQWTKALQTVSGCTCSCALLILLILQSYRIKNIYRCSLVVSSPVNVLLRSIGMIWGAWYIHVCMVIVCENHGTEGAPNINQMATTATYKDECQQYLWYTS